MAYLMVTVFHRALYVVIQDVTQMIMVIILVSIAVINGVSMEMVV